MRMVVVSKRQQAGRFYCHLDGCAAPVWQERDPVTGAITLQHGEGEARRTFPREAFAGRRAGWGQAPLPVVEWVRSVHAYEALNVNGMPEPSPRGAERSA